MFAELTSSKGLLNVAGGLNANVDSTGTVCMRGIVKFVLKYFK